MQRLYGQAQCTHFEAKFNHRVFDNARQRKHDEKTQVIIALMLAAAAVNIGAKSTWQDHN